MKSIWTLAILIIVLGILFYAIFWSIVFLRGQVEPEKNAWLCESGEWVKYGNPQYQQPQVPCY